MPVGESARSNAHLAYVHGGLQNTQPFKRKLRAGGHDYAGARVPEIFAYCREEKPELDSICDRAKAYAQTLL
jgi:hypothetical protein